MRRRRRAGGRARPKSVSVPCARVHGGAIRASIAGGVLNFGDCFSYALAKSLNSPLLFKGNDFATIDIATAVQL